MKELTDEQIKVLKEVARDAELLGDFLAKIGWVIYTDTHATTFNQSSTLPFKEGELDMQYSFKMRGF